MRFLLVFIVRIQSLVFITTRATTRITIVVIAAATIIAAVTIAILAIL